MLDKMSHTESLDASSICNKKIFIHALLDVVIVGLAVITVGYPCLWTRQQKLISHVTVGVSILKSPSCFKATDTKYPNTAALPLLLFKVVATPYQRGFYCDDESIKYPLKDSTVTSAMLYSIGFLLNFISFFVIEFILFKTKTSTSPEAASEAEKRGPQRRIYVYFYNVYCVVLPFVFGAVVSHLITDIAKYSIGRLRPHFMAACKPDVTKYNCSHGYITADVCTGNAAEIREARLSFASGHSSFSMYTMVFLIFYLQSKFSWKAVSLVRPVLQVLCFILAYFTCLSRISDYKHHWSDVLGGAVIGIATAVWVAFRVSELFTTKNHCTRLAENQTQRTHHPEPINHKDSTRHGQTSPEMRHKPAKNEDLHQYHHLSSSSVSSTHLFSINAGDLYEPRTTHSHVTTNI